MSLGRALFPAALCALLFGGVPGSAFAQSGPFEPNDSLAQASGPLKGGTPYNAAFETDNDADWYYFYTSGQAPLDISLTNTAMPTTSVGLGLDIYLIDANGNQLDTATAHPNEVAHIRYTALTAARYFIHVDGVLSYTYQFQIDPASAVTSPPVDHGQDLPAVDPFGPNGPFVVPSNTHCVSRRNFRIRIRRQQNGVALISAAVAVNGKRVAVRKGMRLTAPVDLRGLPKGRFTVRVSALMADGRAISGTRQYRTCARKGPPNSPGPV
jgi:hypothetical protein